MPKDGLYYLRRVLGGTIFAQSQDPNPSAASPTPYTDAALNGSGAFFYAVGYGTGAVNRTVVIDESTTNPVVLVWGFPFY